MNPIYRDITVTRDSIVGMIKVTKGTNMIPIVFRITDFNIPETASATAYVSDSKSAEVRKKLCILSGNEIRLEPTTNIFSIGRNQIQIRIVEGNKTLVTFCASVECYESVKFQDEVEEQPPSLVQQVLSEYGKMTGGLKKEKEERVQGDFDLENKIDVERERINNLMKLQEGSTTGDAELQDIRVGADGKTYANAGEAVRKQVQASKDSITNLKDDLVNLIDYNIIDNSIGVDNKVIGKDTSVFDDNLFAISNPFNVKKGQKVVVKAIGHKNGTIIAMLDGNGYYPLVLTDDTVFKEYSYVATKNMKLVICFKKSSSFHGSYGVPTDDELAKVSRTPESFATQKELFDKWKKLNFGAGKNKFDKTSLIKGYYINTSNGELDESTDYLVSTFISVTENTAYYRNLESNVAFYDAMFNYISCIDFGAGTFTTPTNTAYIRISTYKGYANNLQIEEGEVGTQYEEYCFYDDKVEKLYRRSQIRKPFPTKITPTMGLVNGNNISVEDKDKEGNLYATRWDKKIFKLSKGNDPFIFGSGGWTQIIDVTPFLNSGETISQYNMKITDTGRICVATNKGRVLVSDEEQTTFTEAFTFTNGFSQNTWGCDKYDKYVLFASYGFPPYGDKEPPHEVYLSSDYGATWNKIFDKPIVEMSAPDKFHIHDVAIDPFSEAIIVVTGDYENDRRIYYSYDFGVTWIPTNPNGEYCKIHPTSIVCMPKGIAFGSDDYPNEGIYWWERPYGVDKPKIKEDDIVCVNLFNVVTNKLLTNCGTKGDYLITNYGIFGVIGFIQQNDSRTARLFVTGDGGVSWHEVFFEQGGSLTGFFGARLVEENGKVKIYANYGTKDSSYQLFVADMPIFYNE